MRDFIEFSVKAALMLAIVFGILYNTGLLTIR